MENKNELGRIYGSRISKSGKYLNLIVKAEFNGQDVYITCPVPLDDKKDKPRAEVGSMGHAAIYRIPVFADKATKKQEEKKPEDGTTIDAPLFVEGNPDNLPF